jgi:hypothetical protein
LSFLIILPKVFKILLCNSPTTGIRPIINGLEITTLRHNEIQKLEIYLKKLLKQVQNLPERTANEATYLMMGRANTVLLAVVIRVWTSSFRLLLVEIVSIPRCVALFATDISLLRTANEATYLMMGRIPVVGELLSAIL